MREATQDVNCPNCGHRLEDFRIDRQATGKRDIVLLWMTCKWCRHIALKSWSYAKQEERAVSR
jgi:hypothetical protein